MWKKIYAGTDRIIFKFDEIGRDNNLQNENGLNE